MTIRELQSYGRQKLISLNIPDAFIKADILIEYVLGITKTDLVINASKEISKEKVEIYSKYLNDIINGKPLQYITNNQEFMKLNFYVDENVLIPQPDTEVLVEETLKKVEFKDQILDLCTGSGAIAVALDFYTREKLKTKIYASDISKKALEIARKNAIINNTSIMFVLSDMFENLQGVEFDIIVSNPPYIEKNVIQTLSKEVQNEPLLALDGGEDGLDYYRIIANEGYKHVKPGGYILLEIGYNQKESVINIFNKYREKYGNIKCIKDLNGKDRVIEVKVN